MVYHKREVSGLFSRLPHAGLGRQRGKEQCAGKVCKTTGQHRFVLLKGSTTAGGEN